MTSFSASQFVSIGKAQFFETKSNKQLRARIKECNHHISHVHHTGDKNLWRRKTTARITMFSSMITQEVCYTSANHGDLSLLSAQSTFSIPEAFMSLF